MRAPPPSLAALGIAALLLFPAGASGAETPAQADEVPAAAARGPAEPAEGVPGLSDVDWQLAPIRWRGFVAIDWRSLSAEAQPRRSQLVESGSLQATSYVYQPWFAQLAFGVTGLASNERGGAPTRSNTLGGNGLVSVFPTSRYPFQANFERSDSRTSDQFTGQDYASTRLGARQSYRNPGGDANSTFSVDRSTLTSSSFGRDTVDVWNASHARALGEHRFEGNANRVSNEGGVSGERSRTDRLFARDNFVRDGLLTVETLASYGASEQTPAGSGAPAQVRTDSFQLSGFGTWRPAEDDPLYVTAGARYFDNGTSDGTTSSDLRSVMAHGTANYRANANLLLNAGGSVTQNSAAGGNSVVSTEFGGGNYTPDPRRFDAYLYTSNLGVNLANQTGGEGGSRQLLSGQATHGLQRLFELGPGQALALNASQSLAVTEDSRAGVLRTLTHFGGVSWRVMHGDSLSGFASASASDARTSGYAPSTFQLINLQLSGQGQSSRYASVLANYTVQGTRQESPSSPAAGFNYSANGSLSYQHQRAFDVPQLRYLAIFQRSDYYLNTRQQGDLSAPREQITWSFEQRLEYRIGKLEARLSYRVAEIDGKKNALLFLRLARQFGD